MNFLLTKVLSLTILLLGLFQTAATQDCMLPSPSLNVIETTEHTISVEWEPVEGAVLYQLNLYLTESQELIQQVQTEATSYTFEGLNSDTFYDLNSQSACENGIYGPEDDNSRTTRTRGGLVIIVDELQMLKKECELAATFPVPDDLSIYHEIVSVMPTYDPDPNTIDAIELNMKPQNPPFSSSDYIELLVLRDPYSSAPSNDPDFIVSIYASSQSRAYVDQNHSVWMNEANNPNNWHLIADIDDPQVVGEQLMIGWAQEVELTIACMDIISTEFIGVPVANPAFTAYPNSGGQSAAVTSKEPSVITDVRTYPNPVTNRLIVDLPTQGGTLQIMDVNGKVWHQANTSNLRSEVDTSNWPAGTYILRHDNGEQPHIQRIIKL